MAHSHNLTVSRYVRGDVADEDDATLELEEAIEAYREAAHKRSVSASRLEEMLTSLEEA